MSDIDALAKRVAELSSSVDFWNVVMLWGLALAALAALLIGWSTRLVVVRSGQLSSAQADFDSAKETKLQLALKEKDRQIEVVKKDVAQQQERAAAAETRLAQQIASTGNRNLVILSAQERIAKKLKEFLGQEFEMAYNIREFAEIEIFGTRAAIAGTLNPASLWKELPERGTGAWTQGIKVFFRSDASEETRLAAQKLTAELDETLGKRKVGNLSVGSVGLVAVDPDVDTGVLPSGKDVILILVGPHI